MKRKTKLVLAQLEKELLLLDEFEGLKILGGTSSGYGSGFEGGGDIDSIITYFSSLGMNFTQDSNGNYHMSNGIMIDIVDVYSSGYNGSGDSGSSGMGGGSSDIDAYVDYFSTFGYVFSGGGGGGGGGGTGSYTYHGYNNSGNTAPPDPWTRDSSDKIVAVASVPPKVVDMTYYEGLTLEGTEVKLIMSDGTEVTAYKIEKVKDSNGNYITDSEGKFVVERRFQANCYGQALAGGDYWFMDNLATTGIDEGLEFMKVVTPMYEVTTDKSKASLAIIWNGSEPSHAGTYDPMTNKFIAKGGTGAQGEYIGEAAFRGTQYGDGQIVYYKAKNP